MNLLKMRFLVADDHNIFRKAIIKLLKTSIEPAPECMEAENGIEAVELIKAFRFDIVLLDVSMPAMNGIEACKIILKEYPNQKIIMLTQFDDEKLFAYLYKLGIVSFITKHSDYEELLKAISLASSGKKYFPVEFQPVIEKATNNGGLQVSTHLDFTPQEKILTGLLRLGFTSKEVASKMNLSERTVRTYRERLLEKTGTHNIAELITFASNTGVIDSFARNRTE
jgi:DNA-binding NarL/FixJ family response regulator